MQYSRKSMMLLHMEDQSKLKGKFLRNPRDKIQGKDHPKRKQYQAIMQRVSRNRIQMKNQNTNQHLEILRGRQKKSRKI